MQEKEIFILSDTRVSGAKNLNLLHIEYFPINIELESYEAIIFTSKNSVKAIKLSNINISTKEVYSIGSGTTKALNNINIQPLYTADSKTGDEFGAILSEKLQGKKVIFFRAKEIISNIANTLQSSGVMVDEYITYETSCHRNVQSTIPPNSIIIFSAPSTVECFLKNFTWEKSYKAVAIGSVTLQALPSYIEVVQSDEHTLESCVKKAKEFYN